MTTLTPVLSAYWDDPQSWTLDTYLRHDGYEALTTALGMSSRRRHRPGQGLRAARPRRGGLPHRAEVVVHPAGRTRAQAPSRTTW